MEPAENRVNLFAGEGGLDFFHDVVRARMAATVHDEQPLRGIEHQALFVVEVVVAVLAVFLDAQVRHLADAFQPRGGMRHERYARRDFGDAFHEADAVGEPFEPSLVNADVVMVCEPPEQLPRVVAVFGSSLAQVEWCAGIRLEEFRHAVRVVVMRVAEHADVDLREVYAHHVCVFGEQVRGSRIEQHLVPFVFHVHGKSPFAEQLARAARARDVVYEDLDFHLMPVISALFAVEAGPFDHAVAAFLGAGEAFAGVAFDVDEEFEIARVPGAASFAVVVGALVVDDGVYGFSVLAQPEGFELVLSPVFLVDGDDVVLADPFLGLLVAQACKVARPFAAVVLDAFLAAGIRPRDVPREICLVPHGVGRCGRRGTRFGREGGAGQRKCFAGFRLNNAARFRRISCAQVGRNAAGIAVGTGGEHRCGHEGRSHENLVCKFHDVSFTKHGFI